MEDPDTKNEPFISIITCTYNSEQYLEQCIESVREQKYKNYEHLIVDAFSTDRTPEIISEYARSDSRVSIFQTKPRGISNAMNFGISEAKGKVIHHLHSDDYYYSDQTLNIVYEAFRSHPRKTIVIGLCARETNGVVRSGLLARSTYRRRKLLLRYLIHVNCYIAHPSTFIKKSVFEKHGMFDESFRIAMDYEFWLRVLGKEPYLMLNLEITTFREHEEAASFNREKCQLEEERARKLHRRGFKAAVARSVISWAVEQKEEYNRRRD